MIASPPFERTVAPPLPEPLVASTEPRPARTLLLVTDAWHPQVNGVVRTFSCAMPELAALGVRTEVVHPGLFRTIAAPRYPEIRLALAGGEPVSAIAARVRPDFVHIATEGPLGLRARRWCISTGVPFTTSYHTQFPLYLRRYFGIPTTLTYRFVRWFHGPARRTLVPTERVADELRANGLERLDVWCRGVDTALFRPMPPAVTDLPGPVFVCVGRVALEKNIEAFLDAELPGSKIVVGDGPARARLERHHPAVRFVGARFGVDLVAHYCSADVFVFPSRTDTFGIVMLEANACGLPVAAYPVTGPIDVVRHGRTGWLDDDLALAARRALELPRAPCIEHAQENSWRRCAEVMLAAMQRGRGDGGGTAR